MEMRARVCPLACILRRVADGTACSSPPTLGCEDVEFIPEEEERRDAEDKGGRGAVGARSGK